MIRLGDVLISIERREAFREGIPLRLGSRAFDVLAALLASPGRLVTKTELMQAAWPDVVVEENNLQVQISNLRRQLNLDAKLLETVPRRGYRLHVEPSSSLPPLASNSPHEGSDVLVPVHVIDDEPAVRTALVRQLRAAGIEANGYASASEFLTRCPSDQPGCLLLDVRLSEGSGFDLQAQLAEQGTPWPIVFMSGVGSIEMSVRAMKAGAESFLTKPIDEHQLLSALHEAMSRAAAQHHQCSTRQQIAERYARLTPRERDVFIQLLEGKQNRQIAELLGLQDVTVKMHKKQVMTKLGASNLIHLVMAGRALGMLAELDTAQVPF